MRRSTSLARSFGGAASSSSRSLLFSSSSAAARSILYTRRAAYANDAHVPQDTAAHVKTEPEKLRTYTRDEVSKHAYEDDCWVIINEKVYNVSQWADMHPGGRAVIYAHAGGDATDMWVEVGHTPRARGLMERYCIGKVAEPKRYTGEVHSALDLDDSGYTLPAGTAKEEFLEDASSFRYSTR